MRNQVIPRGVGKILVFVIPGTELTAAVLLCTGRWKRTGLCLSLALMTVFTGYIGLVFFNYFSRVPCSCGGILKNMGWGPHLLFNLLFLLITLSALLIYDKERRKRQFI